MQANDETPRENFDRIAAMASRRQHEAEIPIDLNVTCAVPWTNPEATPVSDIELLQRIAAQRYGYKFTQCKMRGVTLAAIAKTKEFEFRESYVSPPAQSPAEKFKAMTGLAVVIDDGSEYVTFDGPAIIRPT